MRLIDRLGKLRIPKRWLELLPKQELVGLTLRLACENAMRYRLFGLASEMAYSSMLALFPFILTLLTAVGLFAGSSQQTFERLMGQLSQIAPQEALGLVDRYVRDISFGQNRGLLSLSFLGTLWAASGALGAVMTALDLSHEIPQWILSTQLCKGREGSRWQPLPSAMDKMPGCWRCRSWRARIPTSSSR